MGRGRLKARKDREHAFLDASPGRGWELGPLLPAAPVATGSPARAVSPLLEGEAASRGCGRGAARRLGSSKRRGTGRSQMTKTKSPNPKQSTIWDQSLHQHSQHQRKQEQEEETRWGDPERGRQAGERRRKKAETERGAEARVRRRSCRQSWGRQRRSHGAGQGAWAGRCLKI